MGGLLQFIRFVIDPASYAQVVQQGVGLGQQLGSAILRGVGNIEQRIASKFTAAGQAASEALAKALPFSLGVAIERAVERIAEKLKEITVELATTAADVQRVGIEFDSVFGKAGDTLDKFLAKSAPFYGTTVLALRDMAANLGAMAVGFGMGRDEAAGFTERIVKLTGDIATFKGQKFEDTLHAVTGALVGITRPMHMMGVMITEARIEEEAMRETGKKHKDEITQQEKALAALNVMYQLAAPMMGATERQQGSLNLMWAQTRAKLGDVFNAVAQDMIPAFSEFLGWLTKQDWLDTAADKGLRMFGTLIEGTLDIFVAAVEGTKSVYNAWDFMISGMIEGLARFMKHMPFTDTAYWEGVAKAAGEGMDKAGAALIASNAKFAAQFGKPFDLFGPHHQLPKHPAGPSGGGTPGPDANDPKEMEKQVALIREGAKHENTRAEALRRSDELQRRISHELDVGVKDYERQVALEKILHELRHVDADAATKALKDRHDDIASMDKSEDKLRAIRQLKKDVNAQRLLAQTEEETKEWDKLLKQVNGDLNAFSLPEQFINAYEDAISGTEKWSDALMELADNGRLVNTIMGSLGKGAAKSMIKELREMAHAKAIQNVAQGLEWIGHGIWDAAHFNPQAGADFAAAGQAFASAAEWGLLSGAAGLGGGGGGGSSAGAPGQTGGSTTGGIQNLPPVTYIYIDPLDPDNTRAQQVVGGIIQQAIERGVLIVGPTSSAPGNLRGNK